MAEFKISTTVALLSGTVYMLGLAFGPLILAPLSEFVGRRWVYLATSSSIVAFAGGSGAAQNFATLLVCRFFCGFLGSAGVAIGAGTILDVWGRTKASGLARLLFICGPFLGPSMGPLAGAYVMHEYNGDWRWTQWIIVLIGAPVWILILFMRETSDSQVQHRVMPSGHFGVARVAISTLSDAVLRSLTILTTESIAFWITIYTGYAYAVVFSFFASATFVYSLDYDFNDREVGLSFISVIIGYGIAAILNGLIDMTLYARAIRKASDGIPAPEHRLYSAMIGSIFLPIGLFWFVECFNSVPNYQANLSFFPDFRYAWTAEREGPWAEIVASGIPFGLGSFVIFVSTIYSLPTSTDSVANVCLFDSFKAVFNSLPG